MNRRTLAGLLVLNGVLLASLLGLTLGTSAVQAQIGRGGGDYIIAASESGSGADVVFILDMDRGALMAVKPIQRGGRGELDVVGFRPIADDLTREIRGR